MPTLMFGSRIAEVDSGARTGHAMIRRARSATVGLERIAQPVKPSAQCEPQSIRQLNSGTQECGGSHAVAIRLCIEVAAIAIRSLVLILTALQHIVVGR